MNGVFSQLQIKVEPNSICGDGTHSRSLNLTSKKVFSHKKREKKGYNATIMMNDNPAVDTQKSQDYNKVSNRMYNVGMKAKNISAALFFCKPVTT